MSEEIFLYYSGDVRTLFVTTPKVFETIKNQLPDCSIHVRYSFWDSIERSTRFFPNEIRAEDYELSKEDVSLKNIDAFFLSLGAVSVLGEVEPKVDKATPFTSSKTNLSCQYYKIKRVVDQYPPATTDGIYVRMRSDVTFDDFPASDTLSGLSDSIAIIETHQHQCPVGPARLQHGEKQLRRNQPMNEMVWLSTGKNFHEICSQHDHEKEIASALGVTRCYGEAVTGEWFRMLCRPNKPLSEMVAFCFKYTVVR